VRDANSQQELRVSCYPVNLSGFLLFTFLSYNGDRLGIALAQPALIQILSNTKAPYNISTPTAHLALSALSPASVSLMQQKVSKLVQGRKTLLESLELLGARGLGIGKSIGGNDANFVVIPLLERTVGEEPIPQDAKPDSARAHKVYKFLAESSGLVVRYRGNEPGCEGCLRITIGTQEENIEVIKKLEEVLRTI
jgi:histidinol-phosphate aminotransferase